MDLLKNRLLRNMFAKIAASVVITTLLATSCAWAIDLDIGRQTEQSTLAPHIRISAESLQQTFLSSVSVKDAEVNDADIRRQMENRLGWFFRVLNPSARTEVEKRVLLHQAESKALLELIQESIPDKIVSIYFMGSTMWGPTVVDEAKDYHINDLDTVIVVEGKKSADYIAIKKGVRKVKSLRELRANKIDVSVISTEELAQIRKTPEELPKDPQLRKVAQLAATVWGGGVLVYGKNYLDQPPSEKVLIEGTLLTNLLHSLSTELGKYRQMALEEERLEKKKKGNRRQNQEAVDAAEQKMIAEHLRLIKRLEEILLVAKCINDLYRDGKSRLPEDDSIITKRGRKEDLYIVSGPTLCNEFLTTGADERIFNTLSVDEIERIYNSLNKTIRRVVAELKREDRDPALFPGRGLTAPPAYTFADYIGQAI
ncbi:MAG: hypothetical protein ABII88_08485 [Candidatus Omnitrophota bacterium]